MPWVRVCILLAKSKDDTTESAALGGEIPRPEYLVLREALGADLFDFSDVESSTHPLVVRARRRGLKFGLVALGFARRKQYDHFYCTGEDVALPFAALMSAAADFGRITAVIHHAGTRKRRALLRAIPSMAWRNLICIGEEQYRVVVEECRVPRSLVHLLPFWVDTQFFHPGADAGEEPVSDVFACGRENRDYPTLQRAAADSHLEFRVVASGWAPHAGFEVAGGIHQTANVTTVVAPLCYVQLGARYATTKVVAVPVLASSYGAGVTSIVEAMCMAKPVVVSSSPGIVDYVDDGRTGLIVPVGDHTALHRALEELAADPDRCAEMGANGRAYAEEHYRVELHGHRMAGLFGVTPLSGPFSERSPTR